MVTLQGIFLPQGSNPCLLYLLYCSCLENSKDRGAWWATCSPWGRKDPDTTEQLSTYGNSVFSFLKNCQAAQVVPPFHIPASNVSSSFCTSSSTAGISIPFIAVILVGVTWCLIDLQWQLMMTMSASSAYQLFVQLFKKMAMFNWVFCLIYWVRRVLYIFWILALCQIYGL